jgi:hypothetical protein
MITVTVIAIAVLVLAALVVELVVPRVAERRIGTRLTEGGGQATVDIEARPALRLLSGEGDRLYVHGRELELGLVGEGGGLTVLDGFSEVQITLFDFTTGPFEISGFELVRRGPGPYVMRSQALTSGAELLDFGGNHLGAGGITALGAILRQAPLGARRFEVRVEVELESRDGTLLVTAGGGSIAGYPAGPVATMIAAAVARRLDLGP